jgi:hypothetical protein
MDKKEFKEYWKLLDIEDKEICDFIYKDCGLKVRSIDDFTNKKNYNYEKAIPSICKCLLKEYQSNCIDMLLRGLINKNAKGIANSYIIEFVDKIIVNEENYLLATSGLAMQVIVVDDDYDWLYKILQKAKKLGYYYGFLKAITKHKKNKVITQKLFAKIANKKGLQKDSSSEKIILNFLSK